MAVGCIAGRTIRRGAQGFTPARITGLENWYRPESLAALANGASVASWPDSGPKGRAAVQATGANQPTYVASLTGHAGRPAVQFSSAGTQYLTATWTGSVWGQGTIFVVTTPSIGTNTSPSILELGNGTVNTGYQFLYDSGTTTFRTRGSGTNPSAGSGSVPPSQYPAIICGSYTGSVATFEKNGFAFATAAGGSSTTTSMSTLDVGRANWAGGPMTGYISEVIVYSRALTAAERTQIVEYLADKYGFMPHYNATAPQTTPTPDGSGNFDEPGILYFPAGWNSYKYWLGSTPYPSSNDTLENPTIRVSNDGVTWIAPPGLAADPVFPLSEVPGQPTVHNADAGVAFDPTGNSGAGTLYLFGIESDNTPTTVRTVYRSSNDGINWSARQVCTLSGTGTPTQYTSPYLIRKADGTWQLYVVDVTGGSNTAFPNWIVKRGTASSIAGPYTGWTNVITQSSLHATDVAASLAPWHNTFMYDGSTLWCFLCIKNNTQSESRVAIGKSTDDGVTWTFTRSCLIPVGDGGKQNTFVYQATGFLSDDRTAFRVWYGAKGSSITGNWRLWYTTIPRGRGPS